MPPVPSAPVFNVNQARGYDPNINADQASYQQQQAAYSPPRYSMSRRSGDSEGGYGHQRKSSNSLIGKMSRLFKTDIRNERSQAAIERLGAVREGVVRHQYIRPDGTLRDTVLYSVVPEEWPAVRTTSLGLPDAFVGHGERSELLAEVGLTPAGIAERVLLAARGGSPRLRETA